MTTQTAIARAELLQQELTRFIKHVTQLMQPECIILFGSLATGHVDEWSDLDLVVVADTALPFYERIKHVLHSMRPQVGMDILVYTPREWEEMTRQRSFIREEVLTKGQVVYARAG